MPTPASATGRRSAFGTIICGIDGSRADAAAARQAAILAGPDARLELVSVVSERGAGVSAQATLGRNRARRALRQAHDIAREEHARPVERVVDAPWDTRALLEQAADGDLLVLGDHDRHRADGILFGSTANHAIHRPVCPVLIARTPAAGRPFPGLIMLVDDGTPSSEHAANLAERLAAAHGAPVVMATPARPVAAARKALDAHRASLEAALGEPPRDYALEGPAADAIPAAAAALGAGLLILGSRRLRGIRALGSVTERAAPRVSCSVLIVP